MIDMYRKNCERCNRPSYSSSEFGEWFCPTCGNNLTHHPFFDAITFEQIHVKTILMQHKLRSYKKETYPFTNAFQPSQESKEI